MVNNLYICTDVSGNIICLSMFFRIMARVEEAEDQFKDGDFAVAVEHVDGLNFAAVGSRGQDE